MSIQHTRYLKKKQLNAFRKVKDREEESKKDKSKQNKLWVRE